MDRRALGAGLILLLAPEVRCETVKLTTYYPAPAGIYLQMITTGNSFLARDGGRVGVGISSPTAKLEINGDIRIGSDATACALSNPHADGLLRYNAGSRQIEFCNGIQWISLVPSGAFGWVAYPAPVVPPDGFAQSPVTICQVAGYQTYAGACRAFAGTGAVQGSLGAVDDGAGHWRSACWYEGATLSGSPGGGYSASGAVPSFLLCLK